MIDCKSTSRSESLIERVSSANIDGPISLTWLWEIIVRTKRLPDDLDRKVLFIVLRDRLRNLEREVRQHALRVLADLIPIIDASSLDIHMEFLLPDLIINLSHVAPSVRKGTIDVLRIYLKNSSHPDEILKKLMAAVPEDSHLMQGLLMAVPYFSNYKISEDTLLFLMRWLFLATKQEFLRETSICSLAKTRSKLGVDRFNNIIGSEKVQEFQELCKNYNVHMPESEEDNVILETEITLETGPAITMKIHEEDESSLYASNGFSDRREHSINDDSESELITRSPRKVHFGGEVVKMRTPESDSNNQSSDDNDLQTSVIIDRPTSIKITVSDNIAAIKTRHRSLIPVRITTSSNPPTPRKKIKPKRLHKSAPDLGRLHTSKIPLPQGVKSSPKQQVPVQDQQKNENNDGKEYKREEGRGSISASPVPVHNQIEMFHNLTRSPVEGEMTTASMEEPEKCSYTSFQLYTEEVKEEKGSSLSPLEIIVRDLIHKEDTWTKTRALDDLVTILSNNSISFASTSLPQLLKTLFLYEKQPRLQHRAQEALAVIISTISTQELNEVYGQLSSGVVRILPPSGVRLSLLVMKRSSPRQFFETIKTEPNDREAALQALIAATRTFPSAQIDLTRGIHLAFTAMKDNKRAVRQAALEALASLAQVAGNSLILQTVNELSKGEDLDDLLTIIRTRLSRRQLPTVDVDGSIRYSSPREQEELDWLCGGIPSLHKSSSLNTIKVPSSNYWRRNLRHEIDLRVPDTPSFYDSLEDSHNANKDQIWATEASGFPKIDNGSMEKAALFPVYVLNRDASQVNGRNYRNFDRGRSNSPPNRRHQNLNNFTDSNENTAKRFFRQSEQFRKSFSSEHIYNGNVNNPEPTSFSLSSRSSSTSTGSSARSGIWLKDFRSGIPIPINPDTKLKVRPHRQSADVYRGPLIAHESMNRYRIRMSRSV